MPTLQRADNHNVLHAKFAIKFLRHVYARHPMCSGGCKEYWYENRPEISPCAREKTYFNTLTQLIHEWVAFGEIKERTTTE